MSAESKDGVEIIGTWAKAQKSNTLLNAGCVEAVRNNLGGLSLRDSTNPDSPVLHFNGDEMFAFADGLVNGEFGTFQPSA